MNKFIHWYYTLFGIRLATLRSPCGWHTCRECRLQLGRQLWNAVKPVLLGAI